MEEILSIFQEVQIMCVRKSGIACLFCSSPSPGLCGALITKNINHHKSFFFKYTFSTNKILYLFLSASLPLDFSIMAGY